MSEREKIKFFDMFSELREDMQLADYQDVCILEAEIMREQRTINVTLCSYPVISEEKRNAAARKIAEVYALNGVVFRQKDDESTADELKSFCEAEFCAVFPPAIAFLKEAVWECSQNEMKIKLLYGGSELLEKYAQEVSQKAFEKFGESVNFSFEEEKDVNVDELYEQTENMRKTAAIEAEKNRPKKEGKKLIFGTEPKKKAVEISGLSLDSGFVTVVGDVFDLNHRELKKRKAMVVSFDITDYTGSIRVSKFMEETEAVPVIDALKKGMRVKVQGKINFDSYYGDLVLEPTGISREEKTAREDKADEKRVELHLHTQMSAMDGLTDVKKAVETAARWGHKAIAITDHGVVQAFPDAASAGKKNGIKILYGLEGYFVNDMEGGLITRGDCDVSLSEEVVAFDIETTGLSADRDVIIEIGAVKFKDGELGERFSTFVNPNRPIPREITELTGITDDMVRNAPDIHQAMQEFMDYVDGKLLVAHNADFDMGFIRKACEFTGHPQPRGSLDTLELARVLLPELNRHRLNLVAKHLKLPEFSHHRATDDAVTVGYMLEQFYKRLKGLNVENLSQVNSVTAQMRTAAANRRRPVHITLLAKNKTGLRNLYKLVSCSHLEYFRRSPVIPKSVLEQHREGLLVGSACENSELFGAVAGRKKAHTIEKIAEYYDYFEIMPVCNNAFMVRKGMVDSEDTLREFNKTIVKLGEKLKKPVVATGDVHFLEPEEEVYRRILMNTMNSGSRDIDSELPLYFKTTDEMLEEFSYLGAKKAKEVVVTNTNLIADMCEDIQILPDGLHPPTLENSAEELRELVYGKMHALYGEEPPEIVQSRVDTELNNIIGRHYDVIYMSAQKIVQRSLESGYLVGSRGSVGSSLVAFMSGITEVNSLPPHYRCPKCKHADFESGEGWGCGVDMPDKNCPICGEKYVKDGFDIPFATFLGFGGDKMPDIDLNFSGEYQSRAHRHTFELFGDHHVFRAGTIGTVAEKTAFGYVKKYLEERGITVSKSEMNRLAKGCIGVKRTTGQHPGGMIVVPRTEEIYDFCPIQHPADDKETDIITTHFDYHKMEDNLLKLDLLGHDDPTMLRMLGDLTGVDVTTVPLDDKKTMSIFTSQEALGLEEDTILGSNGACAIPEFGTKFVRGMLDDTQPDKFDSLVRISGFSHGTNVWLNNAKDLIVSGKATVSEVISCRDDIMLYLMSKGMEGQLAFKIMENVRKGKGLTPEWEQAMADVGTYDWYAHSCKTIEYMFPKAHAVAYVIMAFRIAWFKVYHPLAFYAAYFTVRAVGFDAAIMTNGIEQVIAAMNQINNNKDATAAEKDMLITLEVCYEFYKRGFSFSKIDVYRSQSTAFCIEGNSLLPPFTAIAGLGETAAEDIVENREGKEFISIEDFLSNCKKVSKTHVEKLKEAGALDGLPETSQMTLF